MPGGGTKLAITQHNPPARLLDLTRSISRAGRVPTGVDRVELAYLDRLLAQTLPVFGIVKTTLGYVVLDRVGLVAVADRLRGSVAWGARDILAMLVRRKPDMVRRAESDLRKLALARCRPGGLARTLAAHLPRGTSYLNVGHSNLTDFTLRGLKAALDARVTVLIHDVIPLDFPQYQRPGTPALFEARLRRVARHSDLVIYNSAHSRDRSESHMAAWGRVPPSVVAHLGVDVPKPGPTPAGIDLTGPYFVALGTIEPRKNHALLLDLWEAMGAAAPRLFILGARGWNNEAVFARLDALLPAGRIHEIANLDDGAVATVLAGARALLFPSVAEGFGLPPVEAAALGVPVVCAALPSVREVLGDIPVYVQGDDLYQWRTVVENLCKGAMAEQDARNTDDFVPPSWQDHFDIVLGLA